jgi:hypothetical protein
MTPARLVGALIGAAGQQAMPLIAGYGRATARKFALMLAASFAAMMAAMGGLGFLLWALLAFVRPMAGPVGTPLIGAALAILVAAILLLMARNAVDAAPQAARKTAGYQAGAVQPEAILREAEAMVRKHKTPVMLAALLIGIYVGSQKR